MSEVELLYNNAGVEPEIYEEPSREVDNDGEISAWYINEIYPPFTAEKQLELIKWLAVKGDFDSSIDIAKNTYCYWTIYFQGARWTAEGFEESLAGLINNLWQDLTEQERTEIADILRG